VQRRSHTHSRLAALLAAVALLTVTTACGSRLTTEEIRAQGVVEGASGDSRTGAAVTAAGENDAVANEVDASTETTVAAATEGGGGDGGGSGGVGGGAQRGGAATSGGPKAPIVIGFVGWLSGSGGENVGATRDAWVAWSRAVNARGGINGHPVQLLIADHGGNESRAVAAARDFVENKGAIALTTGSGGPAVGEYARSKNIPVVGSIATGGTWNSNPMLFPPFGAADANAWGTARLLKRAGKTKVAVAYCAESNDCSDGLARLKKAAAEEGIEIVSEQRFSVTAPDFTAECIQMRSSGADAVYPLGDTGSAVRMAKSCSRQNFRPVWISPILDDSIVQNPEFEGAIGVTPVFPWALRSGSPAIDEMTAALKTYAPARLAKGSIFLTEGWLSAKLFQKAAAKVSDKPTSQDILEGLWAMKGETIDGLASGRAARTFTRGQPTPETFCVFDTKLVGGKWTAPSGLTPICR
jgi:branched-chain amino acid transport system substrate-binding protein